MRASGLCIEHRRHGSGSAILPVAGIGRFRTWPLEEQWKTVRCTQAVLAPRKQLDRSFCSFAPRTPECAASRG